MILDIKKINEIGSLSPTGYCICQLIKEGEIALAQNIWSGYWLEELGFLIDFGWLRLIDDTQPEKIVNLEITEQFEEVFSINSANAFDELWELFPTTYQNRKFKTFKKEDIKKKYYKEIRGDRALHEHILKCLIYELKNTDLQYLRNIKTWIHNRSWEAFSNKVENVELHQKVKTQSKFI